MTGLSRLGWLVVCSTIIPAPLAAQLTPIVPGATCDSVEASGNCALWSVSPATLRYYAKALDGRRIRLTGVIIARCTDQVLYFSAEGAGHGWRESGLQLFTESPAKLNAIDSMSILEVEGVFRDSHSWGLRRYAGALQEVVVLGRHGTVREDSAGVSPARPSPALGQLPP